MGCRVRKGFRTERRQLPATAGVLPMAGNCLRSSGAKKTFDKPMELWCSMAAVHNKVCLFRATNPGCF
jgi:hypothetical protein